MVTQIVWPKDRNWQKIAENIDNLMQAKGAEIASLQQQLSDCQSSLREALVEVERYVAVAREEGDWRRAAESREKQVRAALEPFADFEDHGEPDDKLLSGYWADICNETITFGHMRRLQALASKEGGINA